MGRRASNALLDALPDEPELARIELTERQRIILIAYCRAGSTKEAAYQLGVPMHYILRHLMNIRDKMGATSTAQMIYVLRRDLDNA